MIRKRKKGLNKEMRHQVKGILLFTLALFCFAGLFYTEQAGGAGYLVNRLLRMLAGNAAVALPLIISFYGIKMIIPSKKAIVANRLVGFFLLLFSTIIWMHLTLLISITDYIPEEALFSESIARGLNLEGGGLIGGLLAAALFYLLGPIGSRIIIAAFFILGSFALYLLFCRNHITYLNSPSSQYRIKPDIVLPLYLASTFPFPLHQPSCFPAAS